MPRVGRPRTALIPELTCIDCHSPIQLKEKFFPLGTKVVHIKCLLKEINNRKVKYDFSIRFSFYLTDKDDNRTVYRQDKIIFSNKLALETFGNKDKETSAINMKGGLFGKNKALEGIVIIPHPFVQTIYDKLKRTSFLTYYVAAKTRMLKPEETKKFYSDIDVIEPALVENTSFPIVFNFFEDMGNVGRWLASFCNKNHNFYYTNTSILRKFLGVDPKIIVNCRKFEPPDIKDKVIDYLKWELERERSR